MASSPFEDLSDCYEALINWPKRLAHEAPFYRRLFTAVGATRVLDTACGTGHHAALFHSWQLQVEGADVSESMLARARRNFGEPAGLQWVHRGYAEPGAATESFDVVICVGNSLALAPDLHTAETAVGRMLAATRPGGAVVLQMLNLWSLPDGPCRWQKCVRSELDQRPVVIVKGVHRHGAIGYVDLIVAALAEQETWRSDCVPFLGFDETALVGWMRAAGAEHADVYGGYRGEPFERTSSPDLIAVARKQA